MTRQSPTQKELCCRQITVLAEPELNCVTDTIEGVIEIHPATADLDVGLVHMPFSR